MVVITTYLVLTIKFLIFLYTLILILANYESNILLQKDFFKNGDRYVNKSISPITLSGKSTKDIGVGYVLYVLYQNLVFTIAYEKISNGKFYMFKKINVKYVIKRMFFYYLNISYISIKLLLHIVKMNGYDAIDEYLYTQAYNEFDNRILILIDNEWKINNSWKILERSVYDIMSYNMESPEKTLSLMNSMKKICNNMSCISHESKVWQGIFTNKLNPKISHLVCLETTNNSAYYGYQTSYEAAKNKNFFDKTPIINKYDGSSKISVLLPCKTSEMQQISKEFLSSNLRQLYGGYTNGFDIDILSDKFIIGIDKIKKIDYELEKVLLDLNINNINIKNDLLHSIIKHVEIDWSDNFQTNDK